MTDRKQDEEEKLLLLMDQLISVLDPLQSNSTMRQIWLETHWLRQDLMGGRLHLPEWQLMIFKPPEELRRYEEAALKSKKLADALIKYNSSNS
jgi:hypothetical protein